MSNNIINGVFPDSPGHVWLGTYGSGVNRYTPGDTCFKYKLQGYDEKWIDAGNRRTAYYTNIPPGDYRFRVAARIGSCAGDAPSKSTEK